MGNFEMDRIETSLNVLPRNNCDNILNNHGKLLLQICKNCDLLILNGRKKGDSLGNVTFHGRNGVSTVDYIVCDQVLFQNIEFFIVKPPTSISDHSQIVTWLNVRPNLEQEDTENDLDFWTLDKLPTQFVWDGESVTSFSQALMLPKIQALVRDFLNCPFPITETGIDEAVRSVKNIIYSAALRSLKRKTSNEILRET